MKDRRGGRRTLTDDELDKRRDAIVELLASAWERIGWRLGRCRSPRDLRRALRRVRRFSGDSSGHVIAPFFRVRTHHATRAELSRAKAALTDLEATYRNSEKSYDSSLECAQLAAVAGLSATRSNVERVFESLLETLAEFSSERNRVALALNSWDEALSLVLDQEAFIAQADLTKFLQDGRSAINPKSMAYAMAGFPKVGCRRSFHRCSKRPIAVWPHARFEMYEAIRQVWMCGGISGKTVLTIYYEAILKLPYDMRKESATRNFVKTQLCENWYDLRLALGNVRIFRLRVSKAVPSLIFSEFQKNLSRSKTHEERFIAHQERIMVPLKTLKSPPRN